MALSYPKIQLNMALNKNELAKIKAFVSHIMPKWKYSTNRAVKHILLELAESVSSRTVTYVIQAQENKGTWYDWDHKDTGPEYTSRKAAQGMLEQTQRNNAFWCHGTDIEPSTFRLVKRITMVVDMVVEDAEENKGSKSTQLPVLSR